MLGVSVTGISIGKGVIITRGDLAIHTIYLFTYFFGN